MVEDAGGDSGERVQEMGFRVQVVIRQKAGGSGRLKRLAMPQRLFSPVRSRRGFARWLGLHAATDARATARG